MPSMEPPVTLACMAIRTNEPHADRTCKVLAIFLTIFLIVTVTLAILAVATGFMVVSIGFPGLRDSTVIRVLPTPPGYLP
jgi:hypothetical protein